MKFTHPKGGLEVFGLLWRIILSSKTRITGKLGHVGSIINYFSKRIMGGL